jgi:hypothetical protein
MQAGQFVQVIEEDKFLKVASEEIVYDKVLLLTNN